MNRVEIVNPTEAAIDRTITTRLVVAPTAAVGVASAIATRASQEDTFAVVARDGVVTVAVYDGHCAGDVSHALANGDEECRVHEAVAAAGLDGAKIVDAFAAADAALRKRDLKGGAVAAIASMAQSAGRVLSANVGDCVTIAVYASTHEVLTEKHSPETPSEAKRLADGGHPVVRGRIGGMLNVSRAFGDFALKSGESSAVSIEPYISLSPAGPLAVIVGSDGVFEPSLDVEKLVTTVREGVASGVPADEIATRAVAATLDSENSVGDNATLAVIVPK